MIQGREGGRLKHSILIVDDTVANLLAFSAILRKFDYRLVLAGTGVEALRCTLDEDFSLILMDVRMPDLNGFETAEVLRQRERTRRTPILFVSAYEIPPQHLLQRLVGGVVDFLPSPADSELLARKVATLIGSVTPEETADPSDPNLEKMRWSRGGFSKKPDLGYPSAP